MEIKESKSSKRKKLCEYHQKECYIWKNYKGMKFCQEGWIKYQAKEGIEKEVKEEKFTKPQKETKTTKKHDVKLYIELLDKLIRTWLMLVAVNKCYTCDYIPEDKRELQVGHFIRRGQISVRWDLRNVNLQCAKCNCELHGNLKIYEERLRREIGDGVESLKNTSLKVTKLSKEEMQDQINYLKQLIKTANNE